jgi:hypothetical protein
MVRRSRQEGDPVGRATRFAVGVGAASLTLFGFGAGKAEAFVEDSGTASVSFLADGTRITCTIEGDSSVGYDAQRGFSNMQARTSLVGGPPACEQRLFVISAEAAYLRDGHQEIEQFGASWPKQGVSAFATVEGVVVSMDVRHEAVFSCDQEPGDCFASVVTSPK